MRASMGQHRHIGHCSLAALAASVAGLAFTLPSGLDADQHASPTQEEDEPKDIEAEGKREV